MKDYNVTWSQLVRYVGGESTPEEQQIIREWIESAPKHEECISFIRKIWDTPAEKKQDWDLDASWQRFQMKYGDTFLDKEQGIELRTTESEERIGKSTSSGKESHTSWLVGWGAVAAAIGAIIVIIFLTYQPTAENTERPEMKEIVTKNGQRMQFRLSDGSQVILNAGSKMRVPEAFSGYERRVELSGEAYFEVTPNPQKPFVVYTKRAATRVLGTKFGIKAYPENAQTEVVVIEGKVELRSTDSPTDTGSMITKFQKGVLDKNKTTVARIKDVAPYLGWTKGNLVFDNNSMTQVAASLERWYDVSVKTGDPKLNGLKFTGSFTTKQPLDEVLDAIALSLDITCLKQDTTIIFTAETQTNGEE